MGSGPKKSRNLQTRFHFAWVFQNDDRGLVQSRVERWSLPILLFGGSGTSVVFTNPTFRGWLKVGMVNTFNFRQCNRRVHLATSKLSRDYNLQREFVYEHT